MTESIESTIESVMNKYLDSVASTIMHDIACDIPVNITDKMLELYKSNITEVSGNEDAVKAIVENELNEIKKTLFAMVIRMDKRIIEYKKKELGISS